MLSRCSGAERKGIQNSRRLRRGSAGEKLLIEGVVGDAVTELFQEIELMVVLRLCLERPTGQGAPTRLSTGPGTCFAGQRLQSARGIG